jgi:hypothetical protein
MFKNQMRNFQLVIIISNMQEIHNQVWLLQEMQREDFAQSNGKFLESILNDVNDLINFIK